MRREFGEFVTHSAISASTSGLGRCAADNSGRSHSRIVLIPPRVLGLADLVEQVDVVHVVQLPPVGDGADGHPAAFSQGGADLLAQLGVVDFAQADHGVAGLLKAALWASTRETSSPWPSQNAALARPGTILYLPLESLMS